MTEYAFDGRVAAYASSPSHQSGPSLSLALELADVSPGDLTLDIATGTGFTAHALIGRGAKVDALDVSLPMLRHTTSSTLAGLRPIRGDANALPVRDGVYDAVLCRHALHHFSDPETAICEMTRVAKCGARTVIADTVSPDDVRTASVMHEAEISRDPSHVRNQTVRQLTLLLHQAGLHIVDERACRSTLNFDQWVNRTGGGSDLAVELWARLSAGGVAEAFETHLRDGVRYFSWPVCVVAAVRR